MKIIILTVALFGAVAFGASAGEFQLPEGVQTCVEDDPKLSECIKAAIQDQIPKLHKGNAALGIPAIDPFVIENVRFDYSNGVVQGSLALRGVKIYGISRATIQDLDTTLLEDGLTSVIKIHFPRVYVEGTYKADIKFNDVKMNPRGFFNLTMNDITITHKMSGEFNYVDDVKYLKLNSWDIVPIIKNIRFYASDMLPDPQLNAIILDFINQYWPELYKVLLPETRDTWEPVLIENANKFLQTVPFHTLIRKSEN